MKLKELLELGIVCDSVEIWLKETKHNYFRWESKEKLFKHLRKEVAGLVTPNDIPTELLDKEVVGVRGLGLCKLEICVEA